MVYLYDLICTYGLLMGYFWSTSGVFKRYTVTQVVPTQCNLREPRGTSMHVVDSDSPIIQSRNAVTSNTLLYTPVK